MRKGGTGVAVWMIRPQQLVLSHTVIAVVRGEGYLWEGGIPAVSQGDWGPYFLIGMFSMK